MQQIATNHDLPFLPMNGNSAVIVPKSYATISHGLRPPPQETAMPPYTHHFRHLVLVLLTILCMDGCGGGGGDSGNTGFSISYNTKTLNFDYQEGQAGAPQYISAQGHGNPPDTGIYIGASVEGPGITQPIPISIDENTDTAKALIAPMYGMAPGKYSGVITFLACPDEMCATQFPGSPHAIKYTITVHPLFRAAPSSLELTAAEQQTGSSKSLTLSLPDDSASATSSISYSSGSGWLQIQNQGNTITLTPNATGLAPGVYKANVTLKAGTSRLQQVVVPVSLTVTLDPMQHLHASLDSISFAGVETANIPSQSIALNLPRSASATTTVTYLSAPKNWLKVVNNGGILTLSTMTAGLAPGTYNASLNVSDNVENLNVPVTLTVAPGLVAPLEESRTVYSESSASGEFTFQAAPDITTTVWTASSNQPWLILDKAEDNLGNPVKWHLDPALFGSLKNNEPYLANITISGAGLTSIRKQFVFYKAFSEIAHIDTLALREGESGDVLLNGEGFARLTDFASLLDSGGLSLQSVTVLSDRMALLKLKNVPAGNYSVSLKTTMGAPTHKNILRVLKPQIYSYQAIATGGNKGAITWDPVSKSAFSADLSLSRIHRFGWSGSGFTDTVANVSQPLKLGMDRDYKYLVVVTTDGMVKLFDPVSLAEKSSKTVASLQFSAESPARPLVIDAANRLWLGMQSYNLDNGLEQRFGNTYSGGERAFGSRVGRRMLFSSTGTYSTPPSWSIDVITDTVKMLRAYDTYYGSDWLFYEAESNRDGSYWLTDNYMIYDFDRLKLGSITHPSGWSVLHSQLSRNGHRAYLVAFKHGAIGTDYLSRAESTTPDLPRVFVYDTSPLSATQSAFPLLGSFDLKDYGGCRTYYNDICAADMTMRISDDDRTLFFVGAKRFIVAPIPSAYLPVDSVAPVSVMRAPVSGVTLPLEMRYWPHRH